VAQARIHKCLKPVQTGAASATGWGPNRLTATQLGFNVEAQAAEASAVAQEALSLGDVKLIGEFLGAAGEGVLVDSQDFNTGASLPIKYGESLHATSDGLWAPRDLKDAMSRPDAERWLEATREEISGMVA
jgi:hypothetical protein